MLFAIDFDGTIVEHNYPDIGDPHKETIEFIKDLIAAGHEWTLLTMREGEKLQEALDFLKNYNITPNYVNDNPDYIKKEFNCNPRKVFAHSYLDDRNAFTYDRQIHFFRNIFDIKRR